MYRILIIFAAILTVASCKQETKGTEVEYMETGDPIVDAMSAEIQKDPSPENLYQRAEALYEREEYARAIEDLTTAISKDSLNPKYYHLLADNYMDYYRSKEALKTMRKVLEMYPTRVPSLLKLAEMEYIVKRYDVSMYNCNLVLKDDPQNAEAYFMLGLNFRDQGEIDRAINSFQTAVEFDSELLDAWVLLGDLYSQKGDKKAIDYYNTAILLAPDRPEMKHSKAFHLQNKGDIPSALQLYKDIIVAEPGYGMAYLNSGILYLQMDSVDRAYENFDILASREPTNANAFFYRAQAQYLRGDLDAAVKDLQNTLNLNDEDAEARKLLNDILLEMDAAKNG